MLKNIDRIDDIMEKNPLIIDIRDKEEFDKKRIAGSINLELDKIDEIEQKESDKTRAIIVCCSRGIRSIVAGEKLCDMGYVNVYNLSGGINVYVFPDG